jgi:dienelactone hydrolase
MVYKSVMKNLFLTMIISCIAFILSTTLHAADGIPLTVRDGELSLQGRFFAAAGAEKSAKPTVLVVHEWWGLNAYALRRAEELTAQGWNALAVDMYGEAASSDFPTAVKRSGPFYQNPGLFVQRLELFVAAARARADVDGQRMAAIGFCFGGSAVLQAARANMDLKAVVAFHPGLKTAAPASTMPKARILVCHGGADPFVPPADVAGFISEMTTAQAWWRMEIFGGAVHAFTNPQAGVGVTNVPAEVPFAQAVAHHPEAEAASISAMQAFVRAAF